MKRIVTVQKIIIISSALWLLLNSIVLFASWQVVTPASTTSREPFFQTSHPPIVAGPGPIRVSSPRSSRFFPVQTVMVGQPDTVYAVSICGSLKENIERIMGRYHWRVVWKSPYDYNFDGRVTGRSLPNVLQKLLQPFPLQAVMYLSNRTVAIVPRETYTA